MIRTARIALLAGLAGALLALAGCGGVRDHIRQHNTTPEVLDPVGSYLEPRVGVLTYDQALVEWGHPRHVTDGDKIFLATWTIDEATEVGGAFERMFTAANAGRALNASFEIDSRLLSSYGFSRN
jgi:hypothetical protein